MPAKVSDHALLRWLERAHGIDVDGIRAQLEREASPAAEIGAAYVWIDGVKAVLRDGVVVTCLPKTANETGSGKSKTRRGRP